MPFDDEVTPLNADDPRPQRVAQLPLSVWLGRRNGSEPVDRELRGDLHRVPMPALEEPLAFLFVEQGPGAGQLAPLVDGALNIGRSSSSDLRLYHPSISRRHAVLRRDGNRFLVRDVGSQNGTFVNGARVAVEDVEICAADVLTLGTAVLRLRGAGVPLERSEPLSCASAGASSTAALGKAPGPERWMMLAAAAFAGALAAALLMRVF